MQGGEVDVEHQIALVVRRVSSSAGSSVAPTDLEEEVRRCFGEWADVPVRDFVPIFAERRVRERLRLGHVQAAAGPTFKGD